MRAILHSRRLTTIGWLGFLVLTLTVLCFSRAAWADTLATLTADNVNIRSGAGTAYEKIGSAAQGESFVVVNQQDDWVQIRYTGGVTAWISAQYVALSSNADLPASVRAASGSVNIRSGAGIEYALLGTLNAASSLPVTGESGHWYAVTYNNQQGYVAKWLVAADYQSVVVSDPPATVDNPLPVNGDLTPALVNTDVLNLRAAPDGDILDKLSRGDRLTVSSSRDGWYQVDSPKGAGWVYGEYVQFDQAKSSAVSFAAEQAPTFAGTEPQGRIEIEWRQEDYGFLVTLRGDTLINYRLVEGARSLLIETDMEFTGALPDNYTLQMSLEGSFQNILRLTGTDALHFSLQEEDHGRTLALTIGLSPLVGRLIYLDPGHGSITESGRVDGGTSVGDLYEKDITYDIVLRMESLLKGMGAEVILSRGETTDLTLERRAQPANAAGADVLVSVHVNATTNNPNANGSSTWFHAPADDDSYDRTRCQLLANCLQEGLLEQGGLADYGVREASFAVLRASAMPAVLVETAFITNEADRAKLADAAWRQKAAEGLVEGLLAYFRQVP